MLYGDAYPNITEYPLDTKDILILLVDQGISNIQIPRLVGMNLPIEDVNWWIYTHLSIRWSNVHADSETIFLARILDWMCYLYEPIRQDPKLFSKIITNGITQHFSLKDVVYLLFFHSDEFSDFIREIREKNYPWNYIKKIVDQYHDLNQYHPCITFCELTSLDPYTVVSNVNELETICDGVIKDNPKSVEDYRKGKVNSINHLKGQVMKLTKGKADVKIVSEILERKLTYG